MRKEEIKKEYYEFAIRGDFQNETDLIDVDAVWNYFEKKLTEFSQESNKELLEENERLKDIIATCNREIESLQKSQQIAFKQAGELAKCENKLAESQQMNERLVSLLKDYEQWEADIIMEDKLWWPNRAQDVLRGPIYDKMLELQEKRNSFLQSTTQEKGETT